MSSLSGLYNIEVFVCYKHFVPNGTFDQQIYFLLNCVLIKFTKFNKLKSR